MAKIIILEKIKIPERKWRSRFYELRGIPFFIPMRKYREDLQKWACAYEILE